jgi:WD40 repeat protein
MFKAASIAVGSTDEKLFEELLIGGADGIPRLYKMHRETKRVIGDDANKIREYAALLGRINAAVFSPDGARFAVGSSLDGVGMVRVYQTADAKQVSQFEGALPSVYALTWKPDGSAVAVGGFDGTVRQFDPNTGKLKSQFVVAPATVTAAR